MKKKLVSNEWETGGEELYRVKKTEGERRMKERPSPANADE